MNYSLCKQLKDAGFPQRGHGGYYKPERGVEFVPPSTTDFREVFIEPAVYTVPKTAWYVYVPTLAELVAACGEGFVSLDRKEFVPWAAYGSRGVEDLEGHGHTPEEAVARLWLALNAKGNG